MPGMVIWISGLPGSGKSTIADELKNRHPQFTVLRMDEIRKIATPEPTYSDAERDVLYRALVYFAMRLSEMGRDVLIDATGNRRVWRELARRLIPVYREVYLRCAKEVCIRREQRRIASHEAPRDIYRKGAEGWPVPGMSAAYEEPLNPEVRIDTDSTSAEEAAQMIYEALLNE